MKDNEEIESIRLTEYCDAAGCGCKISPGVLGEILKNNEAPSGESESLLVGNHARDDAAAYKLPSGEVLLSTTDFFTPIVDHPFDFGRVAAANALSDIYAMGGRPLLALSILGWPLGRLSAQVAAETLSGAREICREAGVSLGGGHSIENKEPVFGLAVQGITTIEKLKTNSGAKPGDLLYLTKPLGTGLYSTAWKRRAVTEPDQKELLDQLTRLNREGEKLAEIEGVHAMTDVTGFGLCGHLSEVCRASGTRARIDLSQIPLMRSSREYAAQKMSPGGMKKNYQSLQAVVSHPPEEWLPLVFDPQTNGGLLISVSPAASKEVESVLQAEGSLYTQPIGEMVEVDQKDGPVIEFR